MKKEGKLMISKDIIIPKVSDGKHVIWSSSYSIGIPKIDDQHKELLEFVNGLYSHATGDDAAEQVYFSQVIHKLIEYTKYHFANEEKMMVATKFPGYEEHKKDHEEFVRTIIKTAKDYEAGRRLTLEKLAHFLKDWVLSHIAVRDMVYSQYFKKIATRKSDGTLSITATDIKK